MYQEPERIKARSGKFDANAFSFTTNGPVFTKASPCQSKLAVVHLESSSLIGRFLKPEIGMKKNQEPKMNEQTKEMIARTMIGNNSTHADGQAIYT